jgi:hypothetical protein
VCFQFGIMLSKLSGIRCPTGLLSHKILDI